MKTLKWLLVLLLCGPVTTDALAQVQASDPHDQAAPAQPAPVQLATLLTVPTPNAAQPTPQPAKPTILPTPGAVQPVTPPATVEVSRRPIRSSANVQVELTIADYIEAAPKKKTVLILVADGQFGRVRSQRSAVNATLNVDVTPNIIEGDRLALQMTLEYAPPAIEEKDSPSDGKPIFTRVSPVNESLTVILQSGKAVVVSQAADAGSDRKVTVELRATIVR